LHEALAFGVVVSEFRELASRSTLGSTDELDLAIEAAARWVGHHGVRWIGLHLSAIELVDVPAFGAVLELVFAAGSSEPGVPESASQRIARST